MAGSPQNKAGGWGAAAPSVAMLAHAILLQAIWSELGRGFPPVCAGRVVCDVGGHGGAAPRLGEVAQAVA